MKEILMPIKACAFYLVLMFLVVVMLPGCDQETDLITAMLIDELTKEPEPDPTVNIGHWVSIEGQEKPVFSSAVNALKHADTQKYLNEEITDFPIVTLCKRGVRGTWSAKVEHVMIFSNFTARAEVITYLETRGTLHRVSYKGHTVTYLAGGKNARWKVVAKEFIGDIPDDFREDKHPALNRDEEIRGHPEHGELHISDYDYYLLAIYYFPFGGPDTPNCFDELRAAKSDAQENYDQNSHIRPEVLLETDRVNPSWHFDSHSPFVYPIFDNVDAALLSMKAYQKYMFYKCGIEPAPGGYFVGTEDILRNEMMCGMFQGSLVTGECEWTSGGLVPGRNMIYTVGFTSRALRDRFLESVPETFFDADDPWWRAAGNDSYRVRTWINVIDDRLRREYTSDNKGDRILAINLPNDFPVFCASLSPLGVGKDACKSHKIGRLQ